MTSRMFRANAPIKEQAEVDIIFELYEESGVLHHDDMIKLKEYVSKKLQGEMKKEEVARRILDKMNNISRDNYNETIFDMEIDEEVQEGNFEGIRKKCFDAIIELLGELK